MRGLANDTMESMPRYAAIDIGSNSIRMLAAEIGHGHAHQNWRPRASGAPG